MHNFSTKHLIHSEQEWYEMEGIELPRIEFPGNEMILG